MILLGYSYTFKLAVPTRWNSFENEISSVVSALPTINLIHSEQELDFYTPDADFFKRLKYYVKLLRPLSLISLESQSDQTSIAEVPYLTKKLLEAVSPTTTKSTFLADLRSSLFSSINNRLGWTLSSPAELPLVAAAVHPHFGILLS